MAVRGTRVVSALALGVGMVMGAPGAQGAPVSYVDDLGRGSLLADVATGEWTLTIGAGPAVSGTDASVDQTNGFAVIDGGVDGVRFEAAVQVGGGPFVLVGTSGSSAVELHASGSGCTAAPTGCVPPVAPPNLPCRIQGRTIVCKH